MVAILQEFVGSFATRGEEQPHETCVGVQEKRTTEYVGHKDVGTVEIHDLSNWVKDGELPFDGDADQFDDEVNLQQMFDDLTL